MTAASTLSLIAGLTHDQFGRPLNGDTARLISAGITGPRMDGTAALSPEQAKAVHEAAQAVWHEMKGVLDEAQAEVKRLGGETGETTAKVEKMEKELEGRLDKLETRGNRLGAGGDDEAQAKLAKDALLAYMRKGMAGLDANPDYAKALVTDSDADGGILLPENINPGILEKLVEYSPMRQLANVESIGSGNALKIPVEDGLFAAGWVAQRQARPETASGSFSLEEIPVHELYAMPAASQQMLDDSAFDVEGWISKKLGERFGVLEATAFITGTGVGEPEGVLNGGLSSVPTASSGVVTADDILDLVFDLPEAYAQNGTLLWKRSTTRVLRKQKASGTGEYLWAPGIDAKTPATFAGYAYREAIDMPAVAASAKAALFADFKQLYTILDRKGISVLRDPFTAKPFILYYTTRRVGGQVVKPEAGRVLTVTP